MNIWCVRARVCVSCSGPRFQGIWITNRSIKRWWQVLLGFVYVCVHVCICVCVHVCMRVRASVCVQTSQTQVIRESWTRVRRHRHRLCLRIDFETGERFQWRKKQDTLSRLLKLFQRKTWLMCKNSVGKNKKIEPNKHVHEKSITYVTESKWHFFL